MYNVGMAGRLETQLRQQLAYELSEIEGIQETWMDALDKQDVGVVLESQPDPATTIQIQWAMLRFCREATFRLAREVDELRAAGTEGDDLG